MPNPLVIGYHLIWTAYGWWLPNDPRGSLSKAIASDVIAELGELHYGRKVVQPAGREIRAFYNQAAQVLQYPLRTLDKTARAEVANAFADVIEEHRYTCYACAIMPDHVHLLIRKHKHLAVEMIENLKQASRLRLRIFDNLSPDHPVWGTGGGWKVFLDHPDDMRRTIRYIEQNPLKIGLPAQTWPWVKAYDNWPLHPGHSCNSPYAKRLRDLGRY